MYQIIIVFHILVGLGVIGLVLMQQGKGADAGAAFGSGASGTIFGSRGSSSFLSRTTAIFATLFFATSLGLAVFGGKQVQPKDIMDIPAPPSEVPVIGGQGAAVPTPAASEAPVPAAAAPSQPADKAEVPVPPPAETQNSSAVAPAAKK